MMAFYGSISAIAMQLVADRLDEPQAGEIKEKGSFVRA